MRTPAIRLVQALSKPSLTKMRAVNPSTVTRECNSLPTGTNYRQHATM